MKKLLFAVALTLAAGSAFARDTYVKPHVKRDGTYVDGYHRSSPNSKLYDNYNSSGGTNPYTGDKGYERNENTNPPAYNKPRSSGLGRF